MRSTVIWSFLSVVALSVGGLISGCDSDAAIAKSGEGESCDSSADCSEGLNCLQGACYKKPPVVGGEGGEGTGTGGTTVGPPAPVLGDVGESCTKRADCMEDLGCFNQRCIAAPTGDGGEGNIPGGVVLGKQGETCLTSADCETGLGCLPGGLGQQGPIGYIGVCSPTSAQLVPSGKSCGAECLEDADCCELPVALHIAWGTDVAGVSAPYGTGANSCAELADLIAPSTCTAAATGELAARCFAQAAYCQCDDTWACEAGKCSYAAACSKDGPVVGGCPNFSRSGLPQYAFCDVDAEACQPVALDPICAKDSDCEGAGIIDFPGEICAPDECVCYEKTACYRACNGPLDCKPGFTCDTADSVCRPVAACTTTAECNANPLFGATYACVEEVCQKTCTTNYDCNQGSFALGVNTPICNPDGLCEALGCTSDDQCSNASELVTQPVKMFCTENVAAPGGGVASAITD